MSELSLKLDRESVQPHRRVKVIRPPTFTLRDIGEGLARLREYSDLLWTLSAHRINVRYKQSALGLSWAVLQPVALMLIYTLVFSVIARVPNPGRVPYQVFAFAALLPWTYFSTALTNATNGLVSHAHLVTKVYFPREILPLSYILAALVDLAVAALVMAGLMVYYRVAVTPQVLWVVPIIALLTAFLTGIALIVSALQVRFRDIGVAMPLLLQLWMFATPVVYPLAQVPARLRPYYVLNPMVGIIDSFRAVILGDAPDLRLLSISAIAALVLLPLAYSYFKRVEATVADII
jgi:lipopolysaccharide transport system permease protein